jgi:outer membrane receptor protein involved in Fe transport
MRFEASLRFGAFAASLCCARPLIAQDDANAQTLDGEEPPERVVLEEIIVTATRRATSLQDTPLSVTALSDAQIRAIGARDIIDYFDRVPGLNYTDDGFTGHRIALRGITAGTFLETRPSSAFYLDDTPMMTLASGTTATPQFGGARPQAVDIARVEVLRGPQGTLFGASALGGAIRMITKPADPTELRGNASTRFSTTSHGDDSHAASGMVNLPLVDERMALRVVGYHRKDGGFIDNPERQIVDVNDAETAGGRLAFHWRPARDLEINFKAHAQNRETGGRNMADVGAGEYEQIRYVPTYDDERWELLNLVVDYDLTGAHLTFSTSRLERRPTSGSDVTKFTERILGVFVPSAYDTGSQVDDRVHELRVTSRMEGNIAWLAGLYYQDQTSSTLQDQPTPGFDAMTGGAAASFGYPDNLLHAEYRGTLRQMAAYAHFSYQFAPSWRLNVGARWFDFDYSVDQFTDGLFAGGPSAVTRTADEQGVTPKVGLEYRPNDRALLFLSASEGYRPGGANDYTSRSVADCADELAALGFSVPPDRGFESDALWNLEVGAKTTWLNGRLTVNAVVYHIRWEDMQTLRRVFCDVNAINVIENVDKAESDGFELELTWRPIARLQLSLTAARTKSRLSADSPNVSGEAGEPIPTVPEWTYSAAVDREFNWTEQIPGYLRANYRFADASWSDFDSAIRRRMPSRRLLDVRFGAYLEDWQIELFADNVLDERAVLMHANNVLGEWQMLVWPRSVGISARVEF